MVLTRSNIKSVKNVLLLALLSAFACNAATITGQVVGVADGDTITVLGVN